MRMEELVPGDARWIEGAPQQPGLFWIANADGQWMDPVIPCRAAGGPGLGPHAIHLYVLGSAHEIDPSDVTHHLPLASPIPPPGD